MRAYADSSFILRLVTAEPDSETTIAEYRRVGKLQLLFLTTDSRQAQVAKAEGLKVAPAK